MSQFYEQSQVRQHNGKDGQPIWIIIKGSVYDVTKFIAEHPGGAEVIPEYAGRDATRAFNDAGHSSDALKQLKELKIGELVVQTAPTLALSSAKQEAKAAEAAALSSQINVEDNAGSGKLFCCC